jgi:hypothetical protein
VLAADTDEALDNADANAGASTTAGGDMTQLHVVLEGTSRGFSAVSICEPRRAPSLPRSGWRLILPVSTLGQKRLRSRPPRRLTVQ